MSSHNRSWIAWDGPYQDQIDGLCAFHPYLRYPNTRHRKYGITWENRQVNIRTIEFGNDQNDEILVSSVSGPESLDRRLEKERKNNKPRKTTYIFEGMNRDVATILGNHFQMHPSLFANYDRTANCGSTDNGLYSPLATSLATQPYLSLPYRDLFILPSELTGYFRLGCSNTGRGINSIRVNGSFDPVATINRKCFIWTETRKDGWTCIVICDPPLQTVMIKDEGPTEGHRVPISPQSIEVGYVDFLPAEIKLQTQRGPPTTGFADDLCFYLTKYSTVPGLSFQSAGIVALFAQKIIASHYAMHLNQLRQATAQLQLQMRRRSDFTGLGLAAVEANWSDCQTLQKRLHQYCLDLENILFQLKLPIERPNPRQVISWQDSWADFQMLYHQFDHARTWIDKVNSSITGLTGIAGNRQACREQELSLQAADRARNITILGLVFVPLAYVATLFSMSDAYAPGGERFWLYFAISIPMTILVLGLYQGINWIRKRDKKRDVSH
ncbi:hypothetical protein DER45DRAFT_592302 [Fusarium avenaceum]|nr:hypothetical protein DER45DRAFT_592302 [Fusarium avenaceum]